MDPLAPSLFSAIEATHVAFEGLSHPLRVIGVEQGPVPQPNAVTITVHTVHNGAEKRASCRFSLSNINDERYVCLTLAETMRQVLAGELKGGEIRVL